MKPPVSSNAVAQGRAEGASRWSAPLGLTGWRDDSSAGKLQTLQKTELPTHVPQWLAAILTKNLNGSRTVQILANVLFRYLSAR